MLQTEEFSTGKVGSLHLAIDIMRVIDPFFYVIVFGLNTIKGHHRQRIFGNYKFISGRKAAVESKALNNRSL